MLESGFFVIVFFCIGTILGSFFHVVAERYGTGQSFVGWKKGPAPHSPKGDVGSYCPRCKKPLRVFDLIPLVSYMLSGARCTQCKAEIPVHYPLIELLTGSMAVFLGMQALFSGERMLTIVSLCIAASLLIILLRIDARLMILPDVYIGILSGVAMMYAWSAGRDIPHIVFSVLAGTGALYLLWIGTGGKGIGFGDVKLMIPLGILFTMQGIIALLFFVFFAGGAVSIFLLVTKKVTPKTAIPFGPFLAGAALLLLAFPQSSDLFFELLGV